jgi:hypothetical protein
MMIDELFERSEKLARGLLRDEVIEESSFSLGGCRISTWKNKHERPIARVSICANAEDVIASTDLKSFALILKTAQPSLHKLCDDLDLLRAILPHRLRLLPIGDDSYIDKRTGNQPSPEIVNESLIIYCNDFRSGNVLKIVCDQAYFTTVEVVQVGVEMDFL